MSFGTKMIARPSSSCDCWDCLRSEGLTPPLSLRGRHRSAYQPKDMAMGGTGIDTDRRDHILGGPRERVEAGEIAEAA